MKTNIQYWLQIIAMVYTPTPVDNERLMEYKT
jgi:hypothetical protein